MLQQLSSHLWVIERPQSFGGLEVGTRMSVIRLEGGMLWLHSPVTLDPPLRKELDALGTVGFAVAPNRYHHLYVGHVTEAYPEAQLYAAPGVERKRPDLHFEAILDDEAPSGWAGQIEQLLFRGFPFANEVVFFHPESRTLILTDLAFYIDADSPALTRFAFLLLGGYGRFGPTLLERVLIRDRKAAAESLERILSWDFERVVLAHGRLLERDGRAALRRSYDWLL